MYNLFKDTCFYFLSFKSLEIQPEPHTLHSNWRATNEKWYQNKKKDDGKSALQIEYIAHWHCHCHCHKSQASDEVLLWRKKNPKDTKRATSSEKKNEKKEKNRNSTHKFLYDYFLVDVALYSIIFSALQAEVMCYAFQIGHTFSILLLSFKWFRVHLNSFRLQLVVFVFCVLFFCKHVSILIAFISPDEHPYGKRWSEKKENEILWDNFDLKWITCFSALVSLPSSLSLFLKLYRCCFDLFIAKRVLCVYIIYPANHVQEVNICMEKFGK